MKASSLASKPGSLVCPFCEMGQLRSSSHDSMRCESCDGLISGAPLETLRQISALPDALGSHACEECAHPQMRLLPDGTFHCPSCGSEVVALEASREPMPQEEYSSEAYRCGWIDGRFGEVGWFTENPNLPRWQEANERLEYYHGHRAGSEARNAAIYESGWEEQQVGERGSLAAEEEVSEMG
jgi:ribosomal protein L37AE/L43A